MGWSIMETEDRVVSKEIKKSRRTTKKKYQDKDRKNKKEQTYQQPSSNQKFKELKIGQLFETNGRLYKKTSKKKAKPLPDGEKVIIDRNQRCHLVFFDHK